MRFQKDGPKRRRRTRRELPYGQISLWGATIGNFRREREAKRYPMSDLDTYARTRRDGLATYAGRSETD